MDTAVSTQPLNGIDLGCFDYSSETMFLVTSGDGNRGGLWDVATGEQIAKLNWTAYAAVFSPDGRQLAVASGEFVSIWHISEYIDKR